MSRVFWISGLAVLSGCLTGYLIASCYPGQPGPPVILKTLTGMFVDNIQNDKISLIGIDSRDIRNNFIVISSFHGNRFIPVWRSPKIPAWDIQLADVDGDGRNELAICLFKTERHDPMKKDNRLQIYAWGKNGIYARWRGTFLCYPFQKLTFGDLDQDGKAELITLEHHQQYQFLGVYRWNGFGFDLLSQIRLQKRVVSVECFGNRVHLQSKDGKKSLDYLWGNASLKAQED